jgi:hypothetical protein
MYRQAGKGINETFFRLRLIVLVALTTEIRIAGIFGLEWSDMLYKEGLLPVRAAWTTPPDVAIQFDGSTAILGYSMVEADGNCQYTLIWVNVDGKGWRLASPQTLHTPRYPPVVIGAYTP